jgi:pimeloyl-ACP methyl ester carboxylesterase
VKFNVKWMIVTVLMLLLSASSGVYAQNRVEKVKLPVAQGTLWGTLTLPQQTGPCPVVLMIAGSGPTDRDGNAIALGVYTNSLKMLADSLAQQGIASLRYDKRMVGASNGFTSKEEDLRFEDYVQDAAAWVEKLRQDKRFSSVSILGHSEGALIGTLVAERQPVAGLISVDGSGYPLQCTILRQISEYQPQLYQAAAKIIAQLEKGTCVDMADQDTSLQFLFRAAVQPYLISEFHYDPSIEITKVKVPVLLIQGTRDLQIQVEDAEVLRQANPKAKLVVIAGMNHMLKSVSDKEQDNVSAYSDPTRPLATRLIRVVTDFVKISPRTS